MRGAGPADSVTSIPISFKVREPWHVRVDSSLATSTPLNSRQLTDRPSIPQPSSRRSSVPHLSVQIVISNHNYGEFLTAAIDSACKQVHPNVSVVVVDDGSTDDSRERLRHYEGAVDVVLKENGGQASALNAGLARCRADIVVLLDADDVLKPHAAARLAAAFASDPGIAKVQFRMDVIDAQGRATGITKPQPHIPMPKGDVRSAELAFPFDLSWSGGGGSAFRTSALKRILPIPEDDYPRRGADWYLVHLTTLLGPVVSLPDICASYRVHGRNGYEPQTPQLDLDHVRETIGYARVTGRALARLADELGLERPRPMLSLSELSNRLVSLKLEPELHPVRSDRAWRLVANAVRAAHRRFDIAWPMKAMFIAWFAAAAAAPPSVARRLAEVFMFPERRTSLNALLSRLHHGPRQPARGGA
jgi:Glycosyl transferase family 2